VVALGGVPQERSNLEIGDKCQTNPLERKLATQRDLLVVELVHILKENGRNKSIPKVIISKNSGRPNHPLSIVRLRKERRRRPDCLE
jgi:hypothetical protein